jgi:hypothetical protein
VAQNHAFFVTGLRGGGTVASNSGALGVAVAATGAAGALGVGLGSTTGGLAASGSTCA